jgi:hypothetical protein
MHEKSSFSSLAVISSSRRCFPDFSPLLSLSLNSIYARGVKNFLENVHKKLSIRRCLFDGNVRERAKDAAPSRYLHSTKNTQQQRQELRLSYSSKVIMQMSGYKRSFIATKCINIYLREGNFGGNNAEQREGENLKE